ncbi:MAG TPA: CBS domain-containing protein [Gemmatimonadaceae bacterium]|nr:CBS domain-containing protein [Gemmatimonadaceae bacterium]
MPMKAKDIMSKDPRTVTPEAAVREAARLMKDEDVGVIPVVESGGSQRLVGMLTDRDIAVRVVAEGRSGDQVRVSEVMTANPRAVKEEENVDAVMNLMSSEKVRRVPIVDDRGTLRGIVSQADIARANVDGKKVERTVEKISSPGGRHSQ